MNEIKFEHFMGKHVKFIFKDHYYIGVLKKLDNERCFLDNIRLIINPYPYSHKLDIDIGDSLKNWQIAFSDWSAAMFVPTATEIILCSDEDEKYIKREIKRMEKEHALSKSDII